MPRQEARVVDGPGSTLDLTARIAPSKLRAIKTGATTLLAADSGSLCLFNTAAGYTFTLPAPVVGLWFEFVVDTTITSSAAKVLTDAATTFIKGGFLQFTTAPALANQAANGTTHRSWNGNGTTTGGIQGDTFKLHCISTTVWEIQGYGTASGSVATPFATS